MIVVSRYGKSILRYTVIHDKRITISFAIYYHGILLLKRNQTNTEIQPHAEPCPPTFKQRIPMMHAGGTKNGLYVHKFCEKEK
jgi:hypothetical protein